MADDDEESDEPAVQLGAGDPVEGAPLARIASRLTWPQERSRIREKEGDAVVRTPEGGRELADILDEVDVSYFDSRQEFVRAVEAVVGTGPIPTGGAEADE
jgi:hypothetical protein